MKKFSFSGLFFLFSFIVSAAAMDALPEVVARYGDVQITKAEALALLNRAPDDLKRLYDEDDQPNLLRLLLDKEINRRIVAAMLQEEQITPSAGLAAGWLDEEVKALPEKWHDVLLPDRREMAALAADDDFQLTAAAHEYLRRKVPQSVTVDEGEAERFYRRNQEQFYMPGTLRLAIIESTGDADGKALIAMAAARIRQGESFDRWRQEISPDASDVIELDAADRKRMMSLPVGSVTGPVETGGKMLLIKVIGKEEGFYLPFEEIKGFLAYNLAVEKASVALGELILQRRQQLGVDYFF